MALKGRVIWETQPPPVGNKGCCQEFSSVRERGLSLFTRLLQISSFLLFI